MSLVQNSWWPRSYMLPGPSLLHNHIHDKRSFDWPEKSFRLVRWRVLDQVAKENSGSIEGHNDEAWDNSKKGEEAFVKPSIDKEMKQHLPVKKEELMLRLVWIEGKVIEESNAWGMIEDTPVKKILSNLNSYKAPNYHLSRFIPNSKMAWKFSKWQSLNWSDFIFKAMFNG